MLEQTDRWLRGILIATGTALGAVPSLALAQETPEAAPPEAPAAPAAPQEEQPLEGEVVLPPEGEPEDIFATGESEVIVVTGSIIERRELTTPAPLAVLDKADLDAAGVASIGQILQNLPSQSNAINVQFNNGGDGSTRINLRGLGEGRTLVLVNGRRHVAGGTGANSSVDLNAIPTAIIERVEVLKDGASAVYGSDAIGGVVNIITRTDFEGTEAAVYTGITGDGLGQVIDVSVVTGINSERGNIVFAAGYADQQSIGADKRRYSREDKLYDWVTGEVTGRGSTAVPEGFIFDSGEDVGNEAWNALVRREGNSGLYFNDPELGWRTFQNTGNSDVGEGDYYNYQPENYLVTPQQRYSMFSTGSYKLGDYARATFEATFSNRRSDQRLASEPLFTSSERIVVSEDNHYNPFGRDFIDMRRRIVEAGPRRSIQDINTFRVVAGLDGRLPEGLPVLQGWRWSLGFNFGRTDSKQTVEGNLVLSRVANALGPSFLDAKGIPRCGTPGQVIADCVPLDLFGGVRSITGPMLDYIQFTGTDSGFNQQKMAQLSVTGKLFEIPGGGDAALALGAEYRDESGADIPNPVVALRDATGSKRQATAGDYQVGEAYAEISVVPLLGQTAAEWVELNAAARAFEYDTFGGDFTWKAGALWRIGQGVAVRGTYSTAFRAPSINQLYLGASDDFPPVTDPCGAVGERTAFQQANCEADRDINPDIRSQLRTVVNGNEKLQPETAKIFTAGLVYEPTFAPGLSLTLDYFDIDITSAIQPLSAYLILQECYDRPADQRQYCDLIARNSVTNAIDIINDGLINLGGNDTAGIDVNLRVNQNTAAGAFNFNVEGTWLQAFNETLPNGTIRQGKGVYDLGVFPDWRFNASTLWGLNEWGAGANLRYIGAYRECEERDCKVGTDPEGNPLDDPDGDGMNIIVPNDRTVSAYITGDIFGSYTLQTPMGTSRLSLGVNNVLDQTPAIVYNGFLAASDASTYDYIGRYFYARFMQQF